jgi:arylformamidase
MRDGKVRTDLDASLATPIDAPDWRKLDRAALGLAFNSGAAVADSAAITAAWEERSRRIRAAQGHALDLPYGPKPRNRVDLLRAPGARSTLVFVHGGYWQRRAKEMFAFAAEALLARGINLALVGYTLAPEATLEDMADEIRAALSFLRDELPQHGLDPDALWLSGWSAGAHLVATALGDARVRGAILVSGIYDLEPIRHCWINEALGLDAARAAANSPLLRVPTACPPVVVVAGTAELPLMRIQSRDYAAALARAGLPCGYEEIPAANHFTILEEMARSDGRLCRLIAGMVSTPS